MFFILRFLKIKAKIRVKIEAKIKKSKVKIMPKIKTKFKIKAEFILLINLLLKSIDLNYINFNKTKFNAKLLREFFLQDSIF